MNVARAEGTEVQLRQYVMQPATNVQIAEDPPRRKTMPPNPIPLSTLFSLHFIFFLPPFLVELVFPSFLDTSSLVPFHHLLFALSLARRVETHSLSYFPTLLPLSIPEVSSVCSLSPAHRKPLRIYNALEFRRVNPEREAEQNRVFLRWRLEGVSPWLTRRGTWTLSSRRPSTW